MRYQNILTLEVKDPSTVRAEYEYDHSCMDEKTFLSFRDWLYHYYIELD